MFEYELKAHIDRIESVAARLEVLGAVIPRTRIVREDRYYTLDGSDDPDSMIRLRIDEHRMIVTRKRKHSDDSGFEMNEEIEFTVSDAEAFERFCLSLGAVIHIDKRKEGYIGRIGDRIQVELWQITGLGAFIELEILSEDDGIKTKERCRRELFGLLERLEIPPEAIEPRYYIQMLASTR